MQANVSRSERVRTSRRRSSMKALPSLALGSLKLAHDSDHSSVRALAPQKRAARLVEPLSARAMAADRILHRCAARPSPASERCGELAAARAAGSLLSGPHAEHPAAAPRCQLLTRAAPRRASLPAVTTSRC